MELYRDVRERMNIGVEELSQVSKALYIMGEKEVSARQMLQGRYGFADDEAELLYDMGRPAHANGPHRVFDRLEPLTDAEDAAYVDPDLW